jgi:hypothetical protein
MILNLGLAFALASLAVALEVLLAPPFSKVGNKGHKFVFVVYSDFTIIHHLGQAGVDRVTIHHQK